MIPIIIDVALLLILIFFICGGWKKGLILGISGILAIIIAFYGAGLVADAYSGEFTPMIEPFVSGLVDKSVTEAREEYEAEAPDTSGKNEVESVGLLSVERLGVYKSAAQRIIDEVKQSVSDVGQSFKDAVVGKVSSAITYILTFIVVFILIVIVFAVVANLLNLAFKLPGLELINGLGGAVLGAAKGLLILFAIAWAMRYFAIALPGGLLDKTLLLRWLMGNNLLTTFIGI